MQERRRLQRIRESEFDLVDEASADSFPASDPPSWATGQLAVEKTEDDAVPRGAKPQRDRGEDQGDNTLKT